MKITWLLQLNVLPVPGNYKEHGWHRSGPGMDTQAPAARGAAWKINSPPLWTFPYLLRINTERAAPARAFLFFKDDTEYSNVLFSIKKYRNILIIKKLRNIFFLVINSLNKAYGLGFFLNKRERIKKSINECPSVSDNFIFYTKETL